MVAARHVHDARRAFALALAVTVAFAVVEVVAGALSGSLALISDAGHMLVDSTGLVLALAAAMLARRPASLARSYGYARVEVLVVPLHVVLMLGVAAYIVFEASRRAGDPPDIAAAPVLAVGVVGLALNLVVARLLHSHAEHNLNAHGARLEVLADAAASAGVVISALVILATGWTAIDIIVSLAIAAFVVPRALSLLRRSVSILLEGTPPGVSMEAIERDVRDVPGVVGLHDLHVWALSPGFVALSAHVEVDRLDRCGAQLAELSALLRERHGIAHVTLQPETHEVHEAVECCDFPDSRASLDHMHEPVGAAKR